MRQLSIEWRAGGWGTGARGGGVVSAASARKISGRTIAGLLGSGPCLQFCNSLSQQLPATKPPNFTPAYSKGRLITVCYGGASSSAGNYQSYDQLGRVNVSYQLTSETYPSGRQVITEYDTAGRIAGVKRDATTYYAGGTASNATNRIQYAPQGAVSVMKLGSGKWEHTSFNNRLQPMQIGLGTSGTDSSVLKLDYTYGTTSNNGNVISQTITAPGLTLNQCYGYDLLNRLSTAEERSGGTTCAGTQQWKQAFTYDRFGNRNFDAANTTANVLGPNPTISQASNRFTAGQNYGYDNAGNLTSDPATNVNGIVYDAENRQTQYTKSQQATNYYYYDGDGHRVKKIDSSGTTVFVYNAGGQLIAEYTSGNPSGGGTSYLTSDHLGSTRVVMKSDGTTTTTTRHDFLPFGEEIQAGIGGRTAGQGYLADSVRQKFTQKERDNESRLDYFLARYYSSAQGRFTSADPIVFTRNRLADPQQLNLYGYVRNNPLTFIDATGEEITVEALTPDQQKAVESSIEALRQQSKTADQIFALYDGPKDSSSNLNIHVVDDKFFESLLSDDPGTNKKTTQGYAAPGTVVKDGNGNVITADVEIYIRGSAVDKKHEDKDRKDRKETESEGILGHEIGHGKDITTDNPGFKQRQEDAKKNQTPYKDRPNEKRADQTLKTIGQERVSGKFIKEVRKDLRF